MKKDASQEKNEKGKKCSRPYRLGQRETAMEETSTRLLVAARALILSENALEGFSMEAVARQAGVTRTTVYGRFGSKRGLLEALFDDMGAHSRLGERLPDAFSRTDPVDALQAYIEVFCDFWGSDRALNRRLRGFAALDEEFAAAIASRYERRYHAIKTLLHRVSEPESASSLSVSEELVQTLLALTSFEFYDVLTGERGPQEVAPIVLQLALAAVELASRSHGVHPSSLLGIQ